MNLNDLIIKTLSQKSNYSIRAFIINSFYYLDYLSNGIIEEITTYISELLHTKSIENLTIIKENKLIICDAQKDDESDVTQNIIPYLQENIAKNLNFPNILENIQMHAEYQFDQAELQTKNIYDELLKHMKPFDQDFVNDTNLAIDSIIKEKSARMAYQKIYNTQKNEIEYSELLLRIPQSSTNDFTSIFPFIQTIENCEFQHIIDFYALEQASKHINNNKIDSCLSINIAPSTINNIHILKKYCSILEKINNKNLFIEVTETGKINSENFHYLQSCIKSIGTKIILDDFTSGHTNFNYLLQYTWDYIKLDGGIIRNIDKMENFELIRHIKEFADFKKVSVVAEFVETEYTQKILKKLGINIMQGHFFHKPETVF